MSGGRQLGLTLFVAITVGELSRLLYKGRVNILEVVLEEVNDAFPVLSGPMLLSPKETNELSRQAQSVGADGLLVVMPYYEDEICSYYADIARSVDLSVIIYIKSPGLLMGSFGLGG